ncbi:MAG: carbohydrate ABC transporter permease, partial [Firmicutes bacterium]|nr:carbohydrate ABC transporter permease [Bacillota bacterium]
MNAKKGSGLGWTIFFSVISALYMYPIVMVVLNSLKQERFISTGTSFDLPTAETFAGLQNYLAAIQANGFLESLFYSLFITISSVALILLCCSMCAWYITRVNNWISKLVYLLCAFSMVVPFQMVMFT